MSPTNNAFSKTVGTEACWGVVGTNVGQVGKANDDETGLKVLKRNATLNNKAHRYNACSLLLTRLNCI